MNSKFFKIITFIIIIVLTTATILQYKKSKEYETYLTNEMQRQCKMLDEHLSLTYTILMDFEKNNEISVDKLKYSMYDTVRFLIYDLQDITNVLHELSWMNKKLDILQNKFYPDELWRLEKAFKKRYYTLAAEKKDKINYDDLDSETKKLLKQYKMKLKNYIEYKEDNYNMSITGFEFIDQFNIKNNEWITFINDVSGIVF